MTAMGKNPIGPFHDNVWDYREAGWLGTFPLPKGKKSPPMDGVTGHDGRPPTDDTIRWWRNPSFERQNGNIGIAVPDGVLGIGVDHYENKRGGDTLAELEAK